MVDNLFKFGWCWAISHAHLVLATKARLRLKSNGNSDIQKVNAIATKAQGGSILVFHADHERRNRKRIQSTMKLGTAYLDVVVSRIFRTFDHATASVSDRCC